MSQSNGKTSQRQTAESRRALLGAAVSGAIAAGVGLTLGSCSRTRR